MHFKWKILIIVVGTKHWAFSDFQDILVLWYVSFEETCKFSLSKVGILSLKYRGTPLPPNFSIFKCIEVEFMYSKIHPLGHSFFSLDKWTVIWYGMSSLSQIPSCAFEGSPLLSSQLLVTADLIFVSIVLPLLEGRINGMACNLLWLITFT